VNRKMREADSAGEMSTLGSDDILVEPIDLVLLLLRGAAGLGQGGVHRRRGRGAEIEFMRL